MPFLQTFFKDKSEPSNMTSDSRLDTAAVGVKQNVETAEPLRGGRNTGPDPTREAPDTSKEAAGDSELANPTSTVPAKPAEEKDPKKECPTCKGSGSVAETSKSATVDIDADVEDKFHQLPPLPSPLPTAHPEYVHCMPPEAPTYRRFSVFTAGSIEMGKAVRWQKQIAIELSHLPITVTNPRRGHWNPNATQEAKNEEFRIQVEWELAALEQVDVICFFFDVNTMSPVTMLELGLWAASEKVVVCCDKRFWRAGNVHIVCKRYGVPWVGSFEELAPAVEKLLVKKGMQLDGQGNLIGSNEHVPKETKKKVLGS